MLEYVHLQCLHVFPQCLNVTLQCKSTTMSVSLTPDFVMPALTVSKSKVTA